MSAIEAAGGEGPLLSGDLPDPHVCEAITRELVDRFGRIDILVNCSGTSPQIGFGSVTPQTSPTLCELAGRNVCVNAVASGATETPMTDWIPDDIRAAIAGQTPLTRSCSSLHGRAG